MKTVEFGQCIDEKICVALGFFDGVHIGHRKILEKVKVDAALSDMKCAVSTFADRPNKSESILTYPDRKRLFESVGMDYCVYLYYLKECGKSGAVFFEELTTVYDVGEIVCGEDYRFGSDHLNVRELQKLCDAKGIRLIVIKLFNLDGVRVSSTAIKILLKSGKLTSANKMLGTPYHISGKIVAGQAIGRNIGTPTVNINQPQGIIPLKHGVYGTLVTLGSKQYDAVTNYGNKPTFDPRIFSIESHLIGYDGPSLFGEDITVYFIKYLRSIRKFKNAEELVKQIKKDMRWKEKC